MAKKKAPTLPKLKRARHQPSLRRVKAAKLMTENGGNASKAFAEAGFSREIVHNPQKITRTESWQELMAEFLPDDLVVDTHKSLMKSRTLDHMVFPLGPKEEEAGADIDEEAEEDAGDSAEHTTLTDAQIGEMLLEVNCTVRRIVHGRSARHVYFWAPDNRARKDALDMAYKLKGRYMSEKPQTPQNLTVNLFYNPQFQANLKTFEDNIKQLISHEKPIPEDQGTLPGGE